MNTSALKVKATDFVIPATVGSVAGFLAGLITQKLMNGRRDAAKEAAAYLVNSGVFLIVGGLTWVELQMRKRR